MKYRGGNTMFTHKETENDFAVIDYIEEKGIVGLSYLRLGDSFYNIKGLLGIEQHTFAIRFDVKGKMKVKVKMGYKF